MKLSAEIVTLMLDPPVWVGVGVGVAVAVGVGVGTAPVVICAAIAVIRGPGVAPEVESGTMIVAEAITGGFKGVWLLFTSCTDTTCTPGATLAKVWEVLAVAAQTELPDGMAGCPCTDGGRTSR